MENIEKELNFDNINDTLEYAKTINARIYSKEDKEKVDIVINDFKDTNSKNPKLRIYRQFTNNDVIQMIYTCINTYAIFDDDFLINRINDYLLNTPVVNGGYADDSLFQIRYERAFKDDTYIKIPTSIVIPAASNTKIAGHYLVQEMAKILKNNNYQEEKLFMTYNNVIPIVLTMISAYESHHSETIEVFRKSHDFILKTIQIYNVLLEYIAQNKNQSIDKKNVIIATAGQYLTSFYYALAIFYEYLQKPYSVLEDIDDVLECEATTIDVIQEHIGENSYDKYQKGLAKFKKIIM